MGAARAALGIGIDPAARSAPMHVEVVVHGKYGPPGSADGLVDAMDAPADFDPLAAPLPSQA